MNDDDVLQALRQTLVGARMGRPLEVIIQRGRARRRARRLYRVAGAGLAATAGVVLAVPLLTHAGNTEAGGSGSRSLNLTAWTLEQKPDKTLTLTLRSGQIGDPAALQRALADAGVPAIVKVGEICQSPGGLDQIANVLQGRQLPNGNSVTTITPAAMPAGTSLVISIVPAGGNPIVNMLAELAPADAVVTCHPNAGPHGESPAEPPRASPGSATPSTSGP